MPYVSFRPDRLEGLMAKITRFEDLDCWQQGRELVKMVYKATHGTIFCKDLRLCGQVQAAATSIMAHISEGFIRRSDKEFIQFLFIAMSSAAEVQSHLYVALDQRYIDQKMFDEIYEQVSKVSRMISNLIKYLRSRSLESTKPTRSTKKTKPMEQTKQTE
jgi:four helix bundle protein